jgi:hypothetical protein
MRSATPILLALLVFGAAACNETSTGPRDVTPPAAPRGFYSVTGDGAVNLYWLENTEADVAGYRVYMAPCASGSSCPYDRIGSTSATQFNATGLTNGVTRYYAVAAVDHAGNESALSYEDVFDTPRPAGGATLTNFTSQPANSGWDFSTFTRQAYDVSGTDIYYGDNGSVKQMFTTSVEVSPGNWLYTDIQDAGYVSSLDALDWAPSAGWSPTGTVELIPGHAYYVWTWDDHYAKFRVGELFSNYVTIDWAYQTAVGNPELKARPTGGAGSRPMHSGPRPVHWIRPAPEALTRR